MRKENGREGGEERSGKRGREEEDKTTDMRVQFRDKRREEDMIQMRREEDMIESGEFLHQPSDTPGLTSMYISHTSTTLTSPGWSKQTSPGPGVLPSTPLSMPTLHSNPVKSSKNPGYHVYWIKLQLNSPYPVGCTCLKTMCVLYIKYPLHMHIMNIMYSNQ